MITKIDSNHPVSVPSGSMTQLDKDLNVLYERHNSPSFYDSGAQTITYDGGPKKGRHGNCIWKTCVHTKSNVRNVDPTQVTVRYYDPYYQQYSRYERYPRTEGGGTIVAPDGVYDSSVIADVLGQVDLNTSESVLLYSGVLQAVPLVGGALKLTSLLNRAAKRFKKDLRRKPFTTAVKTLISADFIDRFVISPTIDDARRFADATNYVLRVIETARTRTATPTALSSVKTKVLRDRQTSSYRQGNGGYLYYTQHARSYLESKAFAYLDVRYDISAIDPIRFWANRVGLTRPLDSVWDLVPFSFVIDYFTRAGDFISQLGDKMSSLDGLVGKVGKIHGFWGTFKRCYEIRQKHQRFEPDRMQGMGDPDRITLHHLGSATQETSVFRRFPISDPYSWLSRLERSWGSISLNLSPVRARTIVELLIQAKL